MQCAKCGDSMPRQTLSGWCRVCLGGLGREERDEGRKRVYDNAPDDWKLAAYNVGMSVARDAAEVTPDDMWEVLDQHWTRPRDSRALGQVMLELSRSGVLEATGRVIHTSQPSRHSGQAAVWRSRIYRKGA